MIQPTRPRDQPFSDEVTDLEWRVMAALGYLHESGLTLVGPARISSVLQENIKVVTKVLEALSSTRRAWPWMVFQAPIRSGAPEAGAEEGKVTHSGWCLSAAGEAVLAGLDPRSEKRYSHPVPGDTRFARIWVEELLEWVTVGNSRNGFYRYAAGADGRDLAPFPVPGASSRKNREKAARMRPPSPVRPSTDPEKMPAPRLVRAVSEPGREHQVPGPLPDWA